MARKTIAKAYGEVNAAWPAGELPELTGAEAVRAAMRLWTFALAGVDRPAIEQTSGNRYSRIVHKRGRGRVLVVNPQEGWKRFVHSLSHAFFWVANPGDRPHSKDHARVERALIAQVLRRGWLTGKLQEQPAPALTIDDKRRRKLDLIDAGIERWEAKQRRAENALTKLAKQRKYYAAKVGA